MQKKFLKEYSSLIKEYTSNIKKAYSFASKNYSDLTILGNVPLVEYSLNLAKKLNVYDENIIISSILYNPYKYDFKVDLFSKKIKKITKDLYFINFYDLVFNTDHSPEKIKEMIVNSFFKVEAIVIIFAEALLICDYFEKIKNKRLKLRFLSVLENTILPLSYQLGMQNFKDEILENLMYLKYKKKYKFICNYLDKNYPKNNLDIIKNIIVSFLKYKNKKPVAYTYRYKSPGSFYQKIYVKKEKSHLSEVLDVYAIRLIYTTKKECYEALNLIKKNFYVIENDSIKIRNFIKHPKKNGYRSIHLNLMLNDSPIEIQIRTVDMHNNAEYGLSAHFHYKNIETSEKDLRLIDYLKENVSINELKDKSYKDYITVYTQTNQEILIPKKSTLLDFSFFLHSDFAKHFNYAEINGQIISDKGYLLKNGDKIKIYRQKKVTLKKEDIDFVYVKKNKKKFNLFLK